ncbi:MAG: histidine phosphatase family protein [Saprospiraceae bacterium]
MDKIIFCLRHGQTDYNKNGIVQGSGIDSDLNEMGRLQAQQFYDYYKKRIKFDLIIYSALKRTKQTVFPWLAMNIPSVRDSRINEISWGDSEGQEGTDKSVLLYKNIVAQWSQGNLDIGFKNGETATQLQARIQSFVTELKARIEKNILICTHGRTMRGLLSILTNEHICDMESYEISNVGMYKVVQKGTSFDILTHNDTSHRTSL